MAIESAADRAMFVAPKDFGRAATYLPATGGSVALTGLFDNEFALVELGTGAPISDVKPAYTYPTVLRPSPVRGDRLSIDFSVDPFGEAGGAFSGVVSFFVRDFQRNPPNAGPGYTLLILEAP